MPKSQLETFTDRHEAIALFDHLRGRDPQKPWPLLPILAFIAPGGSGKSTLIAYLRLQKCCLSEGRTALPYASLDFTLPHTPTDLLLILVSLRDQLQQHADGQEKHLTFPRFDLGALIAQATSSAEDLSSFGPQEVRRKLSTGKQAFEAASTLGSTLGHTLPFVPPLLAGLHLAGQIKPVRELLSYLEDSTGWKWYRMHSADTGLNANATMKDVLLRLHVLSMPGKPERDGLVNKLLPAAFIADLLDALVDTDPPRAWSKTANVVFFLDGFEALQRTSSTTATRLLQVLTTEQRKQATTDPFLLVIGSRDRLPGLSEAEQQPAFAQRTSAQDEQAAQKRIRELHTAWQQQLPGNRRFLRLKDLYLTLWLRDFGPDDTRSYLLKFGEREQTRAFTQNGLLVQTIDRVTHGHPLYLALAAEAVLEANARGKTLHPDDFELADVSPEIVPGHEEEQVGDYLLNLFLRQLPEPERKELIFCAAPRFLDIASLRVILQLPTDVEARERWNRYRRLTFMSAIDDHRIVFHPLVRVLLLRQLPPGHEPESDYYRTHTRLREHFHRLASTQPSSMQQGMGDWQVHLEEAYHALALGDPEPAIKLGIDAQHATLAVWEPLLEAVTQAPTAPTALMPANREKPAYDALVQAERHHYTQDGVTAIILYRWLLTASQSVPWKNARLQHNLGIAHSALPAGDRDANLKRAITCYEAALQVYTREAFPGNWAGTQNNLGTAYSNLPAGDRQANLERAITCYEAALQVYTPEAFPVNWAMTQNNLGEAYRNLPAGDRQANLKGAIACYEAALEVRTPEAFPVDWALTQNNLGTAYSNLPAGDRQANLERAIACYEAALQVYTREAFPVDWALTQNNLGLAYRYLPAGDRQANLERAIACYEAALQVFHLTRMDHYLQVVSGNLEVAKDELQNLAET